MLELRVDDDGDPAYDESEAKRLAVKVRSYVLGLDRRKD